LTITTQTLPHKTTKTHQSERTPQTRKNRLGDNVACNFHAVYGLRAALIGKIEWLRSGKRLL
ncbi:MAG TPA: hypothetical protein PKM39_08760, partial [Pseudothauera hydrothermalis]|nr:hypothetical protein [Pseudothauera hydrothermalis]